MTPAEVFEVLDFHRPKVIDGIAENDYQHLLERRQEMIDQGIEVL